MPAVRDLDVAVLRDAVAHLLIEANYNIPADVLDALRAAAAREQSPLARRTLEQIVRNYEVAAADRVPVCQDSGVTVVLLDVGQVTGSEARCATPYTTASAKARARATCASRSPAIRPVC